MIFPGKTSKMSLISDYQSAYLVGNSYRSEEAGPFHYVCDWFHLRATLLLQGNFELSRSSFLTFLGFCKIRKWHIQIFFSQGMNVMCSSFEAKGYSIRFFLALVWTCCLKVLFLVDVCNRDKFFQYLAWKQHNRYSIFLHWNILESRESLHSWIGHRCFCRPLRNVWYFIEKHFYIDNLDFDLTNHLCLLNSGHFIFSPWSMISGNLHWNFSGIIRR